jgi:hypothetical protein
MADIFISYKREDRPIAERLADVLKQLGFDVWWDLELLAGDQYRQVIREVIDHCSVAIVLWSAQSVESDFVVDEASHAKTKGKLCPARIDQVELPFGFGQTHTDDLIGWDGELNHPGFKGLVGAIEERVKRKAKLGALVQTAQSQAMAAELESFKAAQVAGNVSALKSFLSNHPRGAFAAFVRGQIETMQSPASAAQETSVDTAPAPVREQRSAANSGPAADAGGAVARKSPPWPQIAGGAIVAAALVGYFMYQSAQQEARLERAARVAAEERAGTLEKKAQDEQTARAEAERQRLALKQAEQEKEAAARAERDRLAAEKVDEARRTQERESAARAQAERDRLALQQAEQQRLAREKADRERVARDAEAKAKATAQAQPAAYDLAQLDPKVRAAVEAARDAQRRANAAAARARDAAQKAEASGVLAPNSGLGIYAYSGDFAGDRYAGYFVGGEKSGVGVYTYGQNANNKSNSLRFEGEYANGKRNGFGVYYWRSGNRFAGRHSDGARSGPGVFDFASGTRFEGEYANGKRSGPGVSWDSQGRVQKAGLWTNDSLTTPLGAQGR